MVVNGENNFDVWSSARHTVKTFVSGFDNIFFCYRQWLCMTSKHILYNKDTSNKELINRPTYKVSFDNVM